MSDMETMESKQGKSLQLPIFVDLMALAESLKKNGRHGALKKMLMQAWRAESCLGDLRQAQYCSEALRALRQTSNNPTTVEAHIIEKSLLTTSLLLYARATHTSAKGEERGSISLQRGQLSDIEWSDHQALIELRNQAVAHVNPDHRTAGRAWHKQLLFAVRHTSGQWKPASASNETSFHLETFNRLQRMLPVAQTLVLKQFNKRMKAVTDEINGAISLDEALCQYKFDPVKAFGSIEVVQRILTGSGEQTDSFWYNE